MPAPATLLLCLGKSMIRGLVPGGGLVLELVEEGIRTWRGKRSAAERRDELESLSRMAAEEAKAAVEAVLEELGDAGNPAVREAISKYLQRVPQSIRESLERPEDPAGHSLRPDMDVNSADAVLSLLPIGIPSIPVIQGATSRSTSKPQAETQEVIPLMADEDFPDEHEHASSAESARLIYWEPNNSPKVRELTRPYYSIGRMGAKLSLEDPHVSRRHLSLVQLGESWVVLNRSRKRMRLGAHSLRQATLSRGDVIRIGNSVLVFGEPDTGSVGVSLHSWKAGRNVTGRIPKPQASSLRDPHATLESLDQSAPLPGTMRVKQGSSLLAVSTGQPILIGSEGICSIRRVDAGLLPVHALLDWTSQGIQLLNFSQSPTQELAVKSNQQISVGPLQLQVELQGNLAAAAPTWGRISPREFPPVCLSVFYGPHTGETFALPVNEKLTLGRSGSCSLSLPDDGRVSGTHLELQLTWSRNEHGEHTPLVRVVDLDSRNGTVINRKSIGQQGEAGLGDVIQFGNQESVAPSALILHYPPQPRGWMDDSGRAG